MSGILSASPASHSRFLPLISEKDWPVKYSQLSQLGSGKISSIAKSILWQQLYNVTLARARAWPHLLPTPSEAQLRTRSHTFNILFYQNMSIIRIQHHLQQYLRDIDKRIGEVLIALSISLPNYELLNDLRQLLFSPIKEAEKWTFE